MILRPPEASRLLDRSFEYYFDTPRVDYYINYSKTEG